MSAHPLHSTLLLDPGRVAFRDLRSALRGPVDARLNDGARAQMRRSQRLVDQIVGQGRTAYGINTGFGLLARTRIAAEELAELQRNLVLSHSTGTGPLFEDDVVRLVLVLKIVGLGRGHSGVRLEIVDALAALLHAEIYPCIPSKGSVGASGDLAPLAHLAAALLGIGHVRHHGEILTAAEGLRRAGLNPLKLGPKEGLALLNGTQVSTALALKGLFEAERVLQAATVTGALSVDAVKGSDVPFDARIHEARGQRGQCDIAAIYRRLLAESSIRMSHVHCDRVQDPYSLRCQPQVMGSCLDLLRFASATLRTEANAATDNPLLFADDDEVLSGGNFHAEPVAMAADIIALALAEIGSLSERRIALLIDPNHSGLPAFLVERGGVNSGFMIAQVTAAALASENKFLAQPASVDSLPTSANQEDHVSMATFAARRLGEMAENALTVVAIELLAAAQGVEFHAPDRSSEPLQGVVAALRAMVPRYEQDRYFAPDIEAAKKLLRSPLCADLVGELISAG